MTQPRVMREEGTSVEELPGSDWQLAMFVRNSLDWWLIWAGAVHCDSPIPGQVGLSWAGTSSRVTQQSSWFLPPDSCLRSWPGFSQWWTVTWRCMANKPFPRQVACGHGLYHHNRKQCRTHRFPLPLNIVASSWHMSTLVIIKNIIAPFNKAWYHRHWWDLWYMKA